MRAVTRNGILSRFGMPLSRREHEIAELVAKGLNNKRIAYALRLSEATIKAHMGSIYAKLHIHNRVQLTLYRQGYTTMDDNKTLLDSLKGLIREARGNAVPDEEIAAALRQAADDVEPQEDEDLDPAGEGD